MEMIVWNDALRIGMEAIDNQHERLIEIRNRLAQSCQDAGASASEDFHRLLSELFEYTRAHFDAEEAFMQSINYPGITGQQHEHSQFIDTIVHFSEEATSGRLHPEKTVDFLTRWLITHICQSDIQIRYFLEGRHG